MSLPLTNGIISITVFMLFAALVQPVLNRPTPTEGSICHVCPHRAVFLIHQALVNTLGHSFFDEFVVCWMEARR